MIRNCLLALAIATTFLAIPAYSQTNGITMEQVMRMNNRQLYQLVRQGRTPTFEEMDGLWRGFNHGQIARRTGISHYIKDIRTMSPNPSGSNIVVGQEQHLPSELVSWTPQYNADGTLRRRGQFVYQPPTGRGRFGHTVVSSYWERSNNNPRLSPMRLLVNRYVMIDDNLMLGQATGRLGPFRIPVGFFVAEKY